MVELVDAVDSKSSAFGRAGSSPARGTTFLDLNLAYHFALRGSTSGLNCYISRHFVNLALRLSL